jgi:2,3-diaminopropionate biosynthesis protein SbnB
MRILTGPVVRQILDHAHHDIVEEVRGAYQLHHEGGTSLPHSAFLRFPDQPENRIIALPAALLGPRAVAGMKWISSFPGNVARGLERASAVIVLNDGTTGKVSALLEGSLISAWRTAASAALAAEVLHQGPPEIVGLVGAGPIQAAVATFLQARLPGLHTAVVHDVDPARAGRLCEHLSSRLPLRCCPGSRQETLQLPLVCLATHASEPHILHPSELAGAQTVLHLSLRDLGPELLLEMDNLVDDVDHVLRQNTSLHLVEQRLGHRRFIRGTLAAVLQGQQPPRVEGKTVVFSPFGLGLLDLAVARWTLARAIEGGLGLELGDFDPSPWFRG